MEISDHVFIVVSTILFYLFINYYYNKGARIPKKNLLFYTLLIPVIFYGYHFTTLSSNTGHISNAVRSHGARSHASTADIMSDTYPLTSTS